LPYPIYDLALDASGDFIWAATGGGPLLKLDAATGAIVERYGDGLTQTLAIQPGSGLIYIASGGGIEIFHPLTGSFSHFSDIRVGSLAFAPDGTLWAAAWPHDQNKIIRFSGTPVRPELMLELDADIDSIAFGQDGTVLQGMLFVSHTNEALPGAGTELTMVDLATLHRVALASGGSRGDQIKTTADGRILISQSHQVDVLNPVRPPQVVATNPPPDAIVALPTASLTVTFDLDMATGSASDPHSVLNPANYRLQGDTAGVVPVLGVSYDQATRTATLSFDPLFADHYQLRVLDGIQSEAGLDLAAQYDTQFTAISDLSSVLRLHFFNARSDRLDGTVSYDVSVTNTGDHALLLPLILQLSPQQHFDGEPLGNAGRTADGSWLIDLSDALPAGGILAPGASTQGRTLSVLTPNRRPVAFASGVSGVIAGNHAPEFTSNPLVTATAGSNYRYQLASADPDDDPVSYVLTRGPAGMSVDPTSGLISWTPTALSPGLGTVVVEVFDRYGAYDRQSYTLRVDGVNVAPEFVGLPQTLNGREGVPLQIAINAADADGDPLIYWADHLPAGATFDATRQVFSWTPDFHSAGTYPDLRFTASDGTHRVSLTLPVAIAPSPQPPQFLQPPALTALEGDHLSYQLQASDVDGEALSYASDLLPPGAFLNPNTGLFEWTPDYTQHGVYQIPVSVTNGQGTVTKNLLISVQNVNGVPEFLSLDNFQTREGQILLFRAQAFDPDNPTWQAPDRGADGALAYEDDAGIASVSYSVSGLPAGATFDADTLLFSWTPGFDMAGSHSITITATDNGDGTGTPNVVSQTVQISVLNANRAPQISFIANQSVDHDATLVLPVTTSDPDGNPLTLSQIGLPSFGSFTDHGDG
ncbi:MAG: putative Ig domain-containing protein, partial [Rhodocyclaceae bacterium]|nr:putative Ig domain-containing protein [Rhodocyclaceae bacterium]